MDNFNSALSDLLPEASYFPVQMVSSVSIANRMLAERDFDFVIVNSPLPVDPGVRLGIDACSARERLRKIEKKTLSIEEKMEEIIRTYLFRLHNRSYTWLHITG